jgi:hypothetical protein
MLIFDKHFTLKVWKKLTEKLAYMLNWIYLYLKIKYNLYMLTYCSTFNFNNYVLCLTNMCLLFNKYVGHLIFYFAHGLKNFVTTFVVNK